MGTTLHALPHASLEFNMPELDPNLHDINLNFSPSGLKLQLVF
jgi:hypothetical protein